MEKLISMTDFVLSDEVKSQLEYLNCYKLIRNYANFLKQPLTLGMFVPCDEHGNVLEEPKHNGNPLDIRYNMSLCEKYQQAKERCLFEGFEMYCNNAVTDNEISVVFTKSGGILLDRNYETHVENIGCVNKIEDLVQYNLTLTATAQKQINYATIQ